MFILLTSEHVVFWEEQGFEKKEKKLCKLIQVELTPYKSSF